MTKKKHEARIRLRDASNALAGEVWERKWDHLPEILTTPIGECTEILKELERRCPGHTFEEYRDAYCRSMFTQDDASRQRNMPVPTNQLRIEPVFCGPVSVGAVEIVQLIRERFGLSLTEAKDLVDRCVFDGETVAIVADCDETAAAFAEQVGDLESPARFHVHIEAG